jgi:SAM-dependent methyltransferase
VVQTPSRRERILGEVVPSSMRGLEFGPLTQPVVPPHEGAVEYVDYLPTDELRAKYESDPNVDAARIVPVHVVLERGRLPAAAMQGEYGYIVASHVFEHLPDPIGWLQQCADALEPRGLLCLALPDKRYTWDILRPVTRLGEWVEGYCLATTLPTPRQVFDATSSTVLMPSGTPWNRPPTRAELQPERGLPEALELARRSMEEHVDVHCSVFTPAVWLRLLADTQRLGLCPFELAWFHDTRPGEIEFFAGLRNGPLEGGGALQRFEDAAEVAEAAAPRRRRWRPRRLIGRALREQRRPERVRLRLG